MSSSEQIIGRKEELEVLTRIFNSSSAEFLAVYGRRRVGKTYLIRHFFKSQPCSFLNITGIQNASSQVQLKEFTKELARTFYHGIDLKEKNSWLEAFEFLSETISKQVPKNKKVVLFFDEFPWMATRRSKILQALDYYWNRHWSEDKRIKLVICGSAASWIINNIINNKGGLHNRLTARLQLDPFNLSETKAFLHSMNIKLNLKHITQIYMVTGGVPYYLTNIDKSGSATQIIENLAFSKNSFLLKEFDNLYSSLFGTEQIYVDLIRTIAQRKYGIGQEELFAQLKKVSKGGTIVKKLKELEDAGFIINFMPYKHHKKGIYYKVIDEYSLFYFDWIEPIKTTLISKGLRPGYWQKMQGTSAWYSWSGYAFEAICYKHIGEISKKLSLSPASVPTTWRYTPKRDSQQKGAQIDLLFDRDDDAITICEIKYSEEPYVINKQYSEKLIQKINVFKKITRTKKQIFLAMISANGIMANEYFRKNVDDLVILEDLFNGNIKY